MTHELAIIYARYSSDLQRQSSIDDQIRECRAYAERLGMAVVATFSDAATSGTQISRSGLDAAIEALSANPRAVLVAEALDRLSRGQGHIADLYDEVKFLGSEIVTVAEGPVSRMHVGFKGTMNAYYIDDLGKKTRRGLRGRVEQGASGGGNSYGYQVVNRTCPQTGDAIHGERAILDDEARIVRRIFEEYASGVSPRAIASRLNTEGIEGPRGSAWGHSTINGNKTRGTGILNNELYIGRLVWNRLRYVRNPRTRKRISRANPPEEWVITDVPHLRIIPDELWEAVKQRQEATALKRSDEGTPDAGPWTRRRPVHLLSGLIACGCCGSGFSKVSADRIGCSTARNKGEAVCSNRRTIKYAVVEAAVLDALHHHLMEPELVKTFCEEYTRERNRLMREASAGIDALESELRRVNRQIDNMVQAIADGAPYATVSARMDAANSRKAEIEAEIAASARPEPVRLHPRLSETYRERVGELLHGLAAPADAPHETNAARERIRALITRVRLTPDDGATHGYQIDLEGDLAGILALAAGAKAQDAQRQLKLVAGVGFEPTTFRL